MTHKNLSTEQDHIHSTHIVEKLGNENHQQHQIKLYQTFSRLTISLENLEGQHYTIHVHSHTQEVNNNKGWWQTAFFETVTV